MSEPEYYFSRDRKTREGPMSLSDLRDLARQGTLRPEHLVWTDGMPEWVPASKVPRLFDGAPPPIPAPAPLPPPEEPTWEEPAYAGFWLRFLAMIIDGLVLIIPSWTVNAALAMALGVPFFTPASPQNIGRFWVYFLLSSAIGIVGNWLYFALMESSRHQATVGKMALGLRVTDMDLRRLTFGRATGRHFAKILTNLTLLIGYIMAGFTERKQALHDLVASCLVVRVRW